MLLIPCSTVELPLWWEHELASHLPLFPKILFGGINLAYRCLPEDSRAGRVQQGGRFCSAGSLWKMIMQSAEKNLLLLRTQTLKPILVGCFSILPQSEKNQFRKQLHEQFCWQVWRGCTLRRVMGMVWLIGGHLSAGQQVGLSPSGRWEGVEIVFILSQPALPTFTDKWFLINTREKRMNIHLGKKWCWMEAWCLVTLIEILTTSLLACG